MRQRFDLYRLYTVFAVGCREVPNRDLISYDALKSSSETLVDSSESH